MGLIPKHDSNLNRLAVQEATEALERALLDQFKVLSEGVRLVLAEETKEFNQDLLARESKDKPQFLSQESSLTSLKAPESLR